MKAMPSLVKSVCRSVERASLSYVLQSLESHGGHVAGSLKFPYL